MSLGLNALAISAHSCTDKGVMAVQLIKENEVKSKLV